MIDIHEMNLAPRPRTRRVQVATWVHERLARVLEPHGRSLEGDDDAPSVLADEQPALASLYDASAADRQLLGGAPAPRPPGSSPRAV